MIRSFKRYSILLVMILAAMPLFSGCILLPDKEVEVSAAPELVVPAAVSYDTAIEVAKKGSLIIDFVDTAYLKPVNFYDLFFKQSGLKLKEIYVMEGEAVKKGQLVAEADDTSLQNSIKNQQNSLQRNQITLAQLKTTGADEFSIQKAQLDIELVQIQLNKLMEDLEKTKLYSPVDGKVAFVAGTKDVRMRSGEAISVGRTMVRVADHSQLEGEFVINPRQEDDNKFLSYIQTGMKIDIEAGGKHYEGEITFTPKDLKYILDKNDPRLSMVKMKVIGGESLTSGTPLKFTYTYDRKDDVIILPRHIINTYGSLNYVVALEDNKPVEKYIILGMQSSTQVEVKSGLKEGDKIISKRYQQ